jgi:hypothetical protein
VARTGHPHEVKEPRLELKGEEKMLAKKCWNIFKNVGQHFHENIDENMSEKYWVERFH